MEMRDWKRERRHVTKKDVGDEDERQGEQETARTSSETRKPLYEGVRCALLARRSERNSHIRAPVNHASPNLFLFSLYSSPPQPSCSLGPFHSSSDKRDCVRPVRFVSLSSILAPQAKRSLSKGKKNLKVPHQQEQKYQSRAVHCFRVRARVSTPQKSVCCSTICKFRTTDQK